MRFATRLPILLCAALVSIVQISSDRITIYMIGDSTMADKPTEDNPERGWGQLFPLFFDSSVIIENHAKNGRSTRSFLAESLWQPILQKIRPGD